MTSQRAKLPKEVDAAKKRQRIIDDSDDDEVGFLLSRLTSRTPGSQQLRERPRHPHAGRHRARDRGEQEEAEFSAEQPAGEQSDT